MKTYVRDLHQTVLCLIFLSYFCNGATGEVHPCNLTADGINFSMKFYWNVSDLATKCQVKKSNSINNSTTEGPFTVYFLRKTFSFSKNAEVKMWVPLEGCIRIFGTECYGRKLIKYTTMYTFYVAYSTTDKNVYKSDINPSQLLYYIAEEDMYFTPPSFTATRRNGEIFIKFYPTRIMFFNDTTVAEHLQSEAFTPQYRVEYYVEGEKNNIENTSVTSNLRTPKLHTATVSALRTNRTIYTTLPDDLVLCIRIKFVDHHISASQETNFTQVCLPPTYSNEHDQDSTGTHLHLKLALLILIAIFVCLILIFLYWFHRSGLKLMKKTFSINNIHIPDSTNAIITESLDAKNNNWIQEREKSVEADVSAVHVFSSEDNFYTKIRGQTDRIKNDRLRGSSGYVAAPQISGQDLFYPHYHFALHDHSTSSTENSCGLTPPANQSSCRDYEAIYVTSEEAQTLSRQRHQSLHEKKLDPINVQYRQRAAKHRFISEDSAFCDDSNYSSVDSIECTYVDNDVIDSQPAVEFFPVFYSNDQPTLVDRLSD